MSIATEDSDDALLSKAQPGFSPYDEGNSGENISRGFGLKKGPWTSAEDAILVEYVKRHGEGNWNAVQKQSGLLRCGKSCRLRWANHLRPNLKKGTFTAEEERLISELHAKMGNKWARMAARLPGRTDNEIKNYWNTRVKRRQRAGLPLYPPEVYLQVMQENESLNTSGSYRGGKGHHGLLQTNCYEVAGFDFNGLKANCGLLPYAPELPDLSESNFLMKGLGSSQYSSFMPPIMHRQMRFQDSVNLFTSNDEDVSNGLLRFDLIQDDPCINDEHPFGLSFPYDPDPTTNYHFPFETLQGSQSFINGNFSASKPTHGAVKWELPSLQYPETDLGFAPPLLESVDTFMQSESSSPRNSGLLDAVLHESMTLGSAKNHSSDKSSDSSTVTPRELADSSTINLYETEWEEYSESISTFGHSASATSIFSECTPMSCDRSSLNEQTPAETFLGGIVKSEPVDQVGTPEGEREISTHFSCPNVLLESDWIEKIAGCTTKEQTYMNDPIAMLLGGDRGSA